MSRLDVKQGLRIFICHSSNDKPLVRHLFKQLRAYGFDPWLDEEKLLPGQDWNLEIRKAVRSSNVVLVCLSQNSISKTGYVQKEIKYALDIADEQPEGAIFLIPIRLEECAIPDRLRQWQWVNLFEEQGSEKLLKALNTRATELGLQNIISVVFMILETRQTLTYEIATQAIVKEEKERVLDILGFKRTGRFGEPIAYRIYSKYLGQTLSENLTFGHNGILQGDILYIARLEIAG